MPRVPVSSREANPSRQTPSKRMALSQNFLHNRSLVESLVAQAAIATDDLVIEIGPGKGIITEALAKVARHVIAIEKDPVHAAIVQHHLAKAHKHNVTIFAADFLEFPLPATPYRVFANIPFAITAAIVGKLTTGSAPPTSAHLVVQQEAADRFMGNTLQAANLHPWFTLGIDHRFQPRDFVPAPRVESVLLRIEHRPDPLLPVEARQHYEEMVATLFSAWKPSVEAALDGIIGREATRSLRRPLGAQGISLTNRPSRFPPTGWIALYRELAKSPSAGSWWQAFHTAATALQHRQALLKKRTRSHSSTSSPATRGK